MNEVDHYISTSPGWALEILAEMRAAILDAAPGSTEKISYGMPYYSKNGRVAYFAVRKKHCSFHWISEEDKTWY